MNESREPAIRSSIDGGSSGSTAPSTVSDLLYLIAADHTELTDTPLGNLLNRANINFIRGDVPAALGIVEDALKELHPSQSAYDDLLAFRIFLLHMLGEPTAALVESAKAAPGEFTAGVVARCVESCEDWHAGRLFQGLLLNRAALQQSYQGPPVWQMYAAMLLAKKLTDIHVRQQARRTIKGMKRLVDSAGLQAFEPILLGLCSALSLQDGRYQDAIRRGAAAVRIAEQRGTTVGVKIALSVTATARIELGDLAGAAAALETYHAHSTYYVLPDSVARTAFAECVLIAAADGPDAGVRAVRDRWEALGPTSACFVEDLSRPARLVALARDAGDDELAERVVAAAEALATNNPGISVLHTAAGRARAAYGGGEPPSVLDLAPVTSERILSRERRSPERVVPPPPPSVPPVHPRLRELSKREVEIAHLVGNGLTNRQVASRLGLSPHTVNFHLRGVFRKLAISTRVELGRIVARLDR